ncbi:hypothetical protein ACSBR1_021094 [Camellia fascicularis]
MDSLLRIKSKKKYLEERRNHVREGGIENSRRRMKEEHENEEERWGLMELLQEIGYRSRRGHHPITTGSRSL